MIKEKLYYVTSDGNVYETKESAEYHEDTIQTDKLKEFVNFYIEHQTKAKFSKDIKLEFLIYKYIKGEKDIFEQLQQLIDEGTKTFHVTGGFKKQ